MKITRPIVFAMMCLAALSFGPKSEALNPPPDGGYPGFNTAEGQNSLFSLTTGVGNAAIGWYSLFSNTDGSYNTAVGAGTLALNTGDPTHGMDNTAIGAAALLLNTTGSGNTAVGTAALLNNNGSTYNTAVGAFALNNNSDGGLNTATGAFALENNTGNGNTATGQRALNNNTTGEYNTANGISALFQNVTGNNNTAVGTSALQNNTGIANTALGFAAGLNVTTASNVICIGANVLGENADNSCYIGNIFGQTSTGGNAVFINSAGRLGTLTSSRRFKEEIKPMDQASELLFALKPVTFRYKKEIDPAGTSQFGLVAEDVEKVNPDLVVRDQKGAANSVRYEQVNAMLLNEFLKEHRTVQELKKEIAALTATVKEQSAQIRKVTMQVEANKPAPQIVLNGH